jgi:hypothetical protein
MVEWSLVASLSVLFGVLGAMCRYICVLSQTQSVDIDSAAAITNAAYAIREHAPALSVLLVVFSIVLLSLMCCVLSSKTNEDQHGCGFIPCLLAAYVHVEKAAPGLLRLISSAGLGQMPIVPKNNGKVGGGAQQASRQAGVYNAKIVNRIQLAAEVKKDK